MVINCAPSIQVIYKDASYTAGSIQNYSTVGINILPNITVWEFKNAFKRQFETKERFVDIMRLNVQKEFNNILNCPNVVIDSSQPPEYTSPIIETSTIDLSNSQESDVEVSFNDKYLKVFKDYIKSKKEAFYFIIRGIDIGNEKTIHNGTTINNLPLGKGNISGTTTYSTEDCKVRIYAELWDVKENRIMVSFCSIGSGTVFIAFYKTALNQAINDAIVKMLLYLKTGSIYPSTIIPDSSRSRSQSDIFNDKVASH